MRVNCVADNGTRQRGYTLSALLVCNYICLQPRLFPLASWSGTGSKLQKTTIAIVKIAVVVYFLIFYYSMLASFFADW